MQSSMNLKVGRFLIKYFNAKIYKLKKDYLQGIKMGMGYNFIMVVKIEVPNGLVNGIMDKDLGTEYLVNVLLKTY